MSAAPLVTVAIPVRNGARSIERTVRSVLAQDYAELDVLVSDNASSDDTGEIVRALAAEDGRLRYHRHTADIGLLANFDWTKHHARGTFLRWLGDDDDLHPTYVTRCTDRLVAEPRLVLVTTGLDYLDPSGTRTSARYDEAELTSGQALVRFRAWLHLLTSSHLLIDPMYAMTRRAVITGIEHDRMLRGDEVYAAKLALAGPWGHVAESLGSRHWSPVRAVDLVDLLQVPRWHARTLDLLQARRLAHVVRHSALTPAEQRAALSAIAQLYARRHRKVAVRRARKVLHAAGRAAWARPPAGDGVSTRVPTPQP